MPETRLGLARLATIVGLSSLTLGLGLGGSGRLTYHEAFVAQGARELIARGAVLVPTIDGQPWLEKPPLAFWLVALAGKMAGGVSETVARLPSAIAATLLALGVACFTARRFGRDVGWLAGLIQATTFWFVVRGRLAEADIVLACLVTWTFVAFDRLRMRDATCRVGLALPAMFYRQGKPYPTGSSSPLPLGEGPGVRGVAPPVARESVLHSFPRSAWERRPRRSASASPSAAALGTQSVQDGIPTRSVGTSESVLLERQSTFHAPHPGPLPAGEGGQREPASITSTTLRADPVSTHFQAPTSWLWAFFAGLGATALVKGVGFGAVLVGSAVATTLIWDRDRSTIKILWNGKAWALASVLALAWPVLVAIRLPSAVSLWTLHITDRLASHPEHFIGGPWWQYGPAVLGQALPWTPLALVGAWPSLRRAIRERGGVDRLLWAWAVVPVLVLSAATVKNAHYAIHALPPLAIWGALGLAHVQGRLVRRRGVSPRRIRLGALALFVGLGLACGLGHLILGPRFDHRGREWAWCEQIGRQLDPKLPLVVLYEDWDRKPYPTPFGPVPHDWAVRLYYLERAASWRQGVDDLAARPPLGPYALLARERDVPSLRELGQVETLMKGPADRFDREFTLFRIVPRGREPR